MMCSRRRSLRLVSASAQPPTARVIANPSVPAMLSRHLQWLQVLALEKPTTAKAILRYTEVQGRAAVQEAARLLATSVR